MTQDPGSTRVLLDRQEALRAETDRSARRPPVAASRRLVSIYNGGAMPTQANHVFLSHPVDVDGSEAEGSSASPNVNTAATIPVVVLQGVPQAGDLLVATSVGGRWVAERPAGNKTTVCVTTCSPAVPLYGATVTILSGSTTIASGTTSSGGCITFPISGTYTVQVRLGSSVVYSGSRNLPPGGTTTIAISTASVVCCGGYAIPQDMTLTDALGSISFVYYPNSYVPTWYGGHAATLLSSTAATPNNVCIVAAPTEGPVRICYMMTCQSGASPVFSVQRSWSWVYQQGTFTATWYQDPTGFIAGVPCGTSPPAACGGPHTDTSTLNANHASTSAFALSGTPTPSAGNATSDPVGGSIAISA